MHALSGAAGPGVFSAPPLRARLAARVDAWVERLFAADDAAALAQGWTVERTRFGRTYRAAGFPRALDRPDADAISGGER